MREIREILKAVRSLADGEKAVLATVVDLKGSGYRLPGARMLIKANGDATGTVSGGCLEADVMERAKRVLDTGLAEVFTYDTTSEENSVFSLNMGCRGVMRVLLEAVGKGSEIVAALRRAYEKRERVNSAVAIGVDGTAGVKIGDRFFSDYGPPKVFSLLADDMQTFADSTANFQTIKYEAKGGIAEFAFEAIRPPVRLSIFGAGADALPLCEIAHELGWYVEIWDHRPRYISEERFPNTDSLVAVDREKPLNYRADELTAVVSMNHNYDRDKAMLAEALNSNAFYIGALGPKKRTRQILDEFGDSFTGEQLSRLRAPAGLDIGGDTPETIAVSIIAEIQSVLKNRGGGPLRDRTSPIYDRK